MQYSDFHIYRMGADAWGIQWAYAPSRELLQFLLAVKEQLSKTFEVEIIHTYTEILLKNVVVTISENELKDRFREIIKTTQPQPSQKPKIHHIPVCYNPSLGEDIETYTKATSLTIDQLIEIHTKPLYTVYFMGFLPGFPYLEGLDERLYLERKAIPSQKVRQGSVAIGGKQTGIYPQDSPGGWYTIGHTPIKLFDVTREKPSLCTAGDYIKFYAIDLQEHQRLLKEALASNVLPTTEVYEG
ncbi:5-oxoprolinase subunit PxpB [uncultured Dokdonia sp.]|uniref:5-oxoprolinase subunit PxpB n=1 Tax=uncultured Dokdonia sp. TaxID=575653 RepID=UPI00261440D8|nr:5-oxoprolinase subunit PxpB [uncultured Dokdonia sp.]